MTRAGADPVVVVRPAAHSDSAALDSLRRTCRAEVLGRRGGEGLVGSAAKVADHSADRTTHTIVAEVAEAVIGFATLKPVDEAAELSELFVHPLVRGVGVGHELLVAARRLAASCGCARVDSHALPGDRATKNFFEAHGMVTRLLVVSGPSTEADASR
ncbi:MAG: GNAT family N-acetyltransferase [Microthrixaceae bacterium]